MLFLKDWINNIVVLSYFWGNSYNNFFIVLCHIPLNHLAPIANQNPQAGCMMQIIRNTATAIIASSAHTATSLNLALHHCPRNSYLKWLGSRSPIVRQNSSLMFSSTDAPDVMKRLF